MAAASAPPNPRRAPQARWRRARYWRLGNLALAALWLLVIPAALELGWLRSVVFVSAVSLYANFVGHVAAWRADEPTEPGATA